MPEIGTSGLMSGERKRSVAAWPKLPRLSSTLLCSFPASFELLLLGCSIVRFSPGAEAVISFG
jgi:hypothetical protein